MLRGRGTSVCGIGALSDGWWIRAGALGRALELDRVAFGVGDVNRGAQAFGAVTRLDGSGGDARIAQMPADGVQVERLDAETEVVEVPALGPRRRTARAAQRPVDRHQVHQRPPRAQLHQANIVLAPLDSAAQHRAVEMQHRVQIDDAKNDMVNFPEGDHLAFSMLAVSVSMDRLRAGAWRKNTRADDHACRRRMMAVAVAEAIPRSFSSKPTLAIMYRLASFREPSP